MFRSLQYVFALSDENLPPVSRPSPPNKTVSTAKDFNNNCNVLSKAFVNVVGCPVDVYFSPPDHDRGDVPAGQVGPTLEDRSCERFAMHLGPMRPYRASDPGTRDLDDGWRSPLAFQSTYNRHSFVARMSHDGSLVGRIDLDHDEVTDCPEPAATRATSFLGGAGGAREGAGVGARAPSNSTESLCLALDDGSAAIAAVPPTRCSVDAKARDYSAATPLAAAVSVSARIAA